MPLQFDRRVAIRTHANTVIGIGHLMRMRHLATALRAQGIGTLFLLDHPETGLDEVLEGLDVQYLWKCGEQFDLLSDASQMIEQIIGSSIEVVIVDDYRLGATWESEIQQAGYRVVSIDDMPSRRHQCDLLVDQKWRGEETLTSYEALVPAECRQLLGPDYVLLAEEYAQPQQMVDHAAVEPFTILFSLGGGGDLNVLADLIEALRQQPDYESNTIHLQAVVGPASCNRQRLTDLADQGEVELLVGKRSLYPYLRAAALVVGATGGVIYELARLHVPVISFSMSENQQTPQPWLDDIGHYFHLAACSEEDIRRLAQLILLVKGQYRRVQQLFSEAKVQLDGRGAERVAAEICHLFSMDRCPDFVDPKGLFAGKVDEQGYQLRPVGDRDINHYLKSRNLDLNRGNMIEINVIRPIVHYRWWLQTKRDSFLLTQDGEPKLYIWQEMIYIEERPYWIGGWFVCNEGCQYQDTLYALSRQLEWTDQHHPEVPWIAVISRENHFVKLLNQYQGFIEVEQESERGRVIAKAFPKANFDQFYFVTRDSLIER